MASTKTSKPNLTPGAWVRFVGYLLLILVSVIALFATDFNLDNWRGVLEEVVKVLGILTGGTAILNLEKADDQKLNIRELVPAILDLVSEVRTVHTDVTQVPDRVVERLPETSAPQSPQHAASSNEIGLPVYHQTTTAESREG